MRRIAVGTIAALALLGAGATSPVTASIVGDRPSAHDSAGGDGSPSGRVVAGTNIKRDPNTLSASEAASLESRQMRVLKQSGLRIGERADGSVRIPVDFHVITDRQGRGSVSLRRISEQLRVMNRGFSGKTSASAADTPFRFRLNSVERVRNNGWYRADAFTKEGRTELREMRRELHVGNARHLNTYTVGPKFQLLGFATYPSPQQPKLDGMVLLNGSLPGGDADFGEGAVYNEGDTATHEVGHWLNLYHTFQGGCSKLNDYVTDTPRQDDGDNIFSGDESLDTCKPYGPRSKDPVRNFMNYADDPVLNEFTRGQRDRMNTAWFIRRALAATG